MNTKILNFMFLLLAPVASGVLLFLAFPDRDLWWLAWVCLVPLFVTIYDRHPVLGLFLSHLSGFIFFAGICDWIQESPGYTLLHHCYALLFISAPFGWFGFMFSFLSRRLPGISALIAAPFMWVCIEYLRGNFSFLSLPWGFLAHSQYQQILITQISTIAGAYGLSFLIALVNATLAAIFLIALARIKFFKKHVYVLPSKRSTISLLAVTLLLVCLALIHGRIELNKPISAENLKVSVVQGNIEQKKKWDPKHARHIMQTYTELTMEASEDEPDLIVWPEAATPGAINMNRRLYTEVKQLAEKAATPLLIGSTMHQKFESKKTHKLVFTNSAFLVGPEKESENQRYDKILLVPFGEYTPFKKTIPWSWVGVPKVANYTPGNEFTVFEGPNFRFSVAICWESIYPNVVRKFVKNGAQFIVNITNESFYRLTPALHQFVSMSIFRAVENRVYVVRCANTGISCFIDPFGRIVNRVRDATGRDIFVRGVLTESINVGGSETIYTRYGDWLVWLSISVGAAFLLIALIRKRPASVS